MAKFKVSKTITTDVLVIGGGGAGVWAAVEARRAGVEVVIASKGKVGNSGNTIMIGGSYSMDGDSAKNVYGFEGGDENLTKEFLLEQIIKQSFFLAEQDVAEQFVEDSPAVVYETHEWCDRAGQKQIFMAPGGWLLSGRSMGRGLLQGLKENPGSVLVEDVMIVDLLKKSGKVVGAIGIDVYTGEIIRFAAKAVVLATGGYQPFSTKSTNSDMTGDGMAMAYRTGAELADMEFHLPCPTAMEPEAFKGSLLPFLYEVFSGSLPSLDKDGKPIEIPREMAEIAAGSELEKLINTFYWSEAIAEGRGMPGDTMYYDISDLSDEQIKTTFERFIDTVSAFYRPGFYHGDDIRVYRDYVLANGKRVKVGAIFEYTMGGVVISKNMETTVNGLYAAGEVGSGVFGACRVADATTEMIVQGNRAGKSAAAYAKAAVLEEPDAAQIGAVIADMTAPLGRTGGMNSAEFIHKIEQAADLGLGICRTEVNMVKAIEQLEALQEAFPSISVPCDSLRYNYGWIHSLQAKNLLTCTLAGLRAANMRKESRGFHIRHDYKKVDNDNWAVRIVVSDDNGKMSFRTRKAKETKYKIPTGKEVSIPAYIKNQDLNFKNAVFSE